MPSCASCISSSIVISNCCGFGVCVAAEAAIILGPLVGGGGGPLVDAPIVCDGGRDGIRPWPPPLNLGGPLDGGGPGGGWFEKSLESCPSGLIALFRRCFLLGRLQGLPLS